MTQIEQKQSELINILKEQVTQLSIMSKIELGDDVIFAIRDLQNEIENLLQNQVKHSTNTLKAITCQRKEN